MSGKIDDKTYLKYLFQSLNLKELKQTCKDLEIKGYSKYKKADLIDYIIDSMSDEEIEEFLKTKELGFITKSIDNAIDIINGTGRESIDGIKIKDPDNHEIEIDFKGFNWETSSYLSITKDNIHDPERDCDCRIGSEGGLCNHFWVGFIFSLIQKYFKISDWKMTKIPKDLEKKIKTISISKVSTEVGEKDSKRKTPESVTMVDESSAMSKISKYLDSRVTIYQGEINKIDERESVFEGHKSKYYLLDLDKVKIGPQIKKKSDYDEKEIEEISKLTIRLGEKGYNKVSLNVGDKISCNGALTKDNFFGLLLKRSTSIKKVK
ncbi:MAG: Rho termination factor N-terminal domain-containing protein [Candidatus Helarchaeota archaeon]|nr:Rho termination factor N-terminal domain-containing protein [Candidatus Helarchaeota archaeon]